MNNSDQTIVRIVDRTGFDIIFIDGRSDAVETPGDALVQNFASLEAFKTRRLPVSDKNYAWFLD